ncbi:TPA: type I toxin-antitoxin system Fst family toxin [Staphylococcus aureus]|nr:type I toxin-antitoxin system Fst family toxin [Staphylococcus aureus]
MAPMFVGCSVTLFRFWLEQRSKK